MEGESMVLLEVSLINFILWISKEIKWKVKVVLLEVSLMNFILRISNEVKWKVMVVFLEVSLMNFFFRYGQMEDESGVTRSTTAELHSFDMQGDQKEG